MVTWLGILLPKNLKDKACDPPLPSHDLYHTLDSTWADAEATLPVCGGLVENVRTC